MMPDRPKEITVRIPPDEWRKMDDKRHAERETWQSIGTRLFQSWYAGGAGGNGAAADDDDLTDAEEQLVRRVLALVRSGERNAIQALYVALEIGEKLVEALDRGRS